MGDAQVRPMLERIEAAVEGDHRGTLVRLPGGVGITDVVTAFVRANVSEGACLVVVPVGLREQALRDIAKGAPNLQVGEWDDNVAIEVTSPLKAAGRAMERLPDHFAWIVFEECHAANARHLAAIADRFTGARYLEVVRMPAPHPGNVPCEVEVDLTRGAGPTALAS